MSLTPADRETLARALLQTRYGSIPAVEPALEWVESLLDFAPGRVVPADGAWTEGPIRWSPASLDRALATAYPEAQPRPWPGGAPMAIAITHDVDLFDGLSWFGVRALGWLASGGLAVARGRFADARRIAARGMAWTGNWFRRRDPVADLGHWRALEEAHGVRSTFFFLSLARALSREGRLYRSDDPRVIEALHALRDGGWEVGLHAARYDSDTVEGLARQRTRLEAALGADVRAIRYHYLTARFPEAWGQMAEAGFTLSSNIGYHPPHQGFRTGTAWPYQPLVHRGGSIWEAPMALMDVAHGPARTRLTTLFDRLALETRAVGGLLVINFHTNYVAEIDAPGVHAQFREILARVRDAVSEGEAVCLTLGEAVNHLAGP